MQFNEIPRPREIKAYLDRFVVGQHGAKFYLSTAAFNHYVRLFRNDRPGSKIKKANVLLIGPSGSGKTFLIEHLARFMQVGFSICDATAMTEAGYIGDKVENAIAQLLYSLEGLVKNPVAAAQEGIIYVDEVDKLRAHKEGGKDVGGEGVQEAFLKVVEGRVIRVPVGQSRPGMPPKTVEIDTTNILFIVGGAFVGLEDFIRRRLQKEGRLPKKTTLGFKAPSSVEELVQLDASRLLPYATSKDFIEYGMKPEFVGRFPVRAWTNPLTIDQLVAITYMVENSLVAQKCDLLAPFMELRFDIEALHAMAEEAVDSGTGARGMQQIFEEVMIPINIELPSEVCVTREMVINRSATIARLEAEDEAAERARDKYKAVAVS